MALENLGFVALTGWQIVVIILEVLIFLFIPGYLLSLALFPKKEDMSTNERIVMSLPLGIIPIFLLTLLNLAFEVKLVWLTNISVVIVVSIISLFVYYKRGGDFMFLKRFSASR